MLLPAVLRCLKQCLEKNDVDVELREPFLPAALRCLKQCLEKNDVELREHAIEGLIELATYESLDSDVSVSHAGEVDARIDAFAVLLPLLREDAVRVKVTEALESGGVLIASHVRELVTMATDVSGSDEARVWALELIITHTSTEASDELEWVDDDEDDVEELVPLKALVPLLAEDALREKVMELLTNDDMKLRYDAVDALVQLATDLEYEDFARLKAIQTIIDDGALLSGINCEELVPLLAEDALREKVVELLNLDYMVFTGEGTIDALVQLATDRNAEDVARLEAIKVIIAHHGFVYPENCKSLVPLLAEDALREKVVELLGNDNGNMVEYSEQVINALMELAKDDEQLDDARLEAMKLLANLGPNVLAATIRGLLDINDIKKIDEMGVKKVLEKWMRKERARGHVATLKALVEFASSTERSPQSRTIAMQLLATFHNYFDFDVDQMPPLDDLALSETLLEGAFRILAKDLFDDSDAEEKPDDDTVKDARLCVCKLLAATGDMDCLMPNVAAIASLHPGPARIGAREIFRKLVAPDLPARIVQLLGHGCYTVRLLCLIQLESFTPGQLSREIWTAIEALQADSHDEVKALASLMVKNQLQPPGANHMYQKALAEFDAQRPPRLKRAKTAP